MKYIFLIVPYIQFLLRLPSFIQNDDYKFMMMSYVLSGFINATIVAVLLFFLLKSAVLKKTLDYFVFFIFSFYMNYLIGGTISFPFSSLLIYPAHQTYLFTERMQLPLNLVPIVPLISDISNQLAMLFLFYNFILLAPMTFTLLYFGWIKNIKKLLVLVLVYTILIEAIQLFEMVILSFYEIVELRVADINDIILNFISGIIGILAYKIFFSVVNKVSVGENNIFSSFRNK